MRLTRRCCIKTALSVAFGGIATRGIGSPPFSGLVSKTEPPSSLVVSLDIKDEQGKKIKGGVLIIPDGMMPKQIQDELSRQAREGISGTYDFGDAPRTLILNDPPSKYGIGVNLPLSVVKPNFKLCRVNIGPIPSETSSQKPYHPPTRAVQLIKRDSVSLNVSDQPGTKGRFAFDVIIQNNESESPIRLENFRAELRRDEITGGAVAEDRVDDIEIIDIDSSGKARASLEKSDINVNVKAWFPYDHNPDPMIIESEFLHEVPPKDSRRYRISLGVSSEFLTSHGFVAESPWVHSQHEGDPAATLRQFYRYIVVEICGHFKDESDSSEFNKADNEPAESCEFFIRPMGRFVAKGVLHLRQ